MRTSLASLLSIALLSGCGSDAPDEPYGGEVLVTHVQDPQGGNVLRLSAYFIAAQDPDSAPADVALGACGPDHSADQADAREYIDVGESVTFHLGDIDHVVPRLVADPDSEICQPGVPCADGVTDFLDRMHDIAYVDELVDPELGEGFLMGEDEIVPAEPLAASGPLRVLQPPIMEVDGWQTEFPVELARGRDLEVAWRQTEPADDLTVRLVFVPDADTLSTTCVAPDTGTFTVPAAVIDGLESDSGVMILYSVSRATVTTEAGRAIDVRAEYHGHVVPFARSTTGQ